MSVKEEPVSFFISMLNNDVLKIPSKYQLYLLETTSDERRAGTIILGYDIVVDSVFFILKTIHPLCKAVKTLIHRQSLP